MLQDELLSYPTYGLRKEILFCDESHVSNQPYLQCVWSKVSQPLCLPTPKKRERTSVFGAMTLSSGRVYYRCEKKGHGKAFICFIRQLMSALPDRLLLLVVDNSSIHLSKVVRAFLSKTSRVTLFTLPTYSPEYNPIERFWLWMKRQLSSACSYSKISSVKKALRSLMMRYNEGWHDALITFEFGVWKKLRSMVQAD